ncbi:hypothetical protein FQR65_LT20367 [Abscondita terminalis]|nr:hypothetical protein FQR65_LT20367 [Abscondita terminalis]
MKAQVGVAAGQCAHAARMHAGAIDPAQCQQGNGVRRVGGFLGAQLAQAVDGGVGASPRARVPERQLEHLLTNKTGHQGKGAKRLRCRRNIGTARWWRSAGWKSVADGHFPSIQRSKGVCIDASLTI